MPLESIFYAACGGFEGVSDLNGAPGFGQSRSFAAGDCDVRWKTVVRPSHGLPAMEDLSSHIQPANPDNDGSPHRRKNRPADYSRVE